MLLGMSGIGFTEASGSLGGTTVGKGRQGTFGRVKVKPINPRTNKQISQQARFSSRSSAFRGLDQSEQDAWIAAAASGEWPQKTALAKTYNPTGAQLFNRVNLVILQAGGSTTDVPPTKVALSQVLTGALTAAAGTPALSLTFTGTLGSDERLLVYATGNTSAGVNRPGASDYRFLTAYSSTSPANLLSAYQAVYGNPVEGQKIFVTAKIANRVTGQVADAGGEVAVVAA